MINELLALFTLVAQMLKKTLTRVKKLEARETVDLFWIDILAEGIFYVMLPELVDRQLLQGSKIRWGGTVSAEEVHRRIMWKMIALRRKVTEGVGKG